MKINWSHKNMVSWRMVLSCAVSKVSVSRSPEDKEFFRLTRSLNQWKFIYIASVRLILMVELAKPAAVELSAWIGVCD